MPEAARQAARRYHYRYHYRYRYRYHHRYHYRYRNHNHNRNRNRNRNRSPAWYPTVPELRMLPYLTSNSALTPLCACLCSVCCFVTSLTESMRHVWEIASQWCGKIGLFFGSRRPAPTPPLPVARLPPG
jgi:hypothetical protein